MNKEKIVPILVGSIFVIIGLVFLSTLINIIDSSSVYKTMLPLVLIGGGIGAASGESKKPGLGIGLLLIGIVALLVRFNVLSGKAVSFTAGIILLICGIVILTKVADRISAHKKTD